MRVLVAEDERRLAGAIARGLRREGMAVDITHDGASALFKARVVPYDVVVLDRDLPEMHGDEVCRRLSDSERETKVLMLTAADEPNDIVDGLTLGADDYLPKPFEWKEGSTSTSRRRSSASSRRSWPPTAPPSRSRTSCSVCGTSTPTPSPTRSA
jgi:DNA-binding response OmpR family regulator